MYTQAHLGHQSIEISIVFFCHGVCKGHREKVTRWKRLV